MKKVSVCIVLQDNYWGVVNSFNASGFAIVEKEVDTVYHDTEGKRVKPPPEFIKTIDGIEVELLVAIKGEDGNAVALQEYFAKRATKVIMLAEGVSDAHAHNRLFALTTGEYVCILNPYVFLEKYWLTELLYHHQAIEKCGVIGICEDYRHSNYTPLLSKQGEGNFISAFVPDNNMIANNGVCLFLREELNHVGAFDESVELAGNELRQLQLRFVALGYNNCYIPNQSCLVLDRPMDYNKVSQGNKNLYDTLAEMKKVKNYYIPLPSN